MVNEITMPSMGADMTEGTIVKWLKNEGDKISNGDKLAEIETDKTVVEMEAYNEGFLRKITSSEGSSVKVGNIIGYIGDMDDDIPETPIINQSNETKSEEIKEVSEKNNVSEEIIETPGVSTDNLSSDKSNQVDISINSDSIRIKASPMAKRLAKEKNIQLSNIIGTGPGGRISKDDVNNYIPGPNLVSSSDIVSSKNISLDDSDIPLNLSLIHI